MTATADEKLQKVLARAGFGSRRELERWIVDGRVSVNGRRATLGDRVTPHDKVRVDGVVVNEQARRQGRTRVLAYHKPGGEICARRDPEGRRTVFESLPGVRDGRWVMVGRLDVGTSGLLLFTSNGELAHRLMHPSTGLEREYAVRVFGQPDASALKALTEGVELDGQKAKFETLRHAGGEGANQWYHVTLTEGRYREVRRLWETQGLVVSRLIRVRYGHLQLPQTLKAGRWMELGEETIATLWGDEPPETDWHSRSGRTPPAARKGRTSGRQRGQRQDRFAHDRSMFDRAGSDRPMSDSSTSGRPTTGWGERDGSRPDNRGKPSRGRNKPSDARVSTAERRKTQSASGDERPARRATGHNAQARAGSLPRKAGPGKTSPGKTSPGKLGPRKTGSGNTAAGTERFGNTASSKAGARNSGPGKSGPAQRRPGANKVGNGSPYKGRR